MKMHFKEAPIGITSLRAPSKRAWIYVGGSEENTTTKTIMDDLKIEYRDIDKIEYMELKISGRLNTFQVSFKFEYIRKYLV